MYINILQIRRIKFKFILFAFVFCKKLPMFFKLKYVRRLATLQCALHDSRALDIA